MTAGAVMASARRRRSLRRIAVHARVRARANGRALGLLAAVLLLIALASMGVVYDAITWLIQLAEPFVTRHEVVGAFVFAALAALSSMLVFVSSVLLVPLGVAVWGKIACFALLWTGWFLGGVATYSIGRYLGRPAVNRFLSKAQVRRYEHRVPRDAPLHTALLIQLSVPSDIAGYFFGLLGYPRWKYFIALGIAELPYALGTVYLGAAFVEGNTAVLVVAAVTVFAFAAWEWRRVSWKSKPAPK